MKHQVLISGAGIGGLTTALAFLARGWKVRVFEQASQLEEVGAGVQLDPNGMKVLEALGVADAVRDRAFRPEALEMRTGRSGHRIFRVPLKDKTLDRWGGDYLHIHRADLQAVLVEALADRSPDALVLDARAAGYRQGETGATLKLIDGRLFEADLVVGADGLKSALRSQMHGPEAARFMGNVAWRAVVPTEALGDLAPPPTACVWTGPKRHAVTYRLRGGSLCNLVGIVERDDTGAESWNRMGKADAFAADFAEFHPIIRRMVEEGSTELMKIYLGNFRQLIPIENAYDATPIEIAVRRNDYDKASFLLEKYTSDLTSILAGHPVFSRLLGSTDDDKYPDSANPVFSQLLKNPLGSTDGIPRRNNAFGSLEPFGSTDVFSRQKKKFHS